MDEVGGKPEILKRGREVLASTCAQPISHKNPMTVVEQQLRRHVERRCTELVKRQLY